VADVGEEKTFVDSDADGDVGGVLVGGGVGGALIGVPFPTYVGIAALLVVIPFLFFQLPLLVDVPVTSTRNWTFCYEMTGLTTPVVNLLRVRLVVFSSPLLEDLAEALDDERHFLVIELGGVDGKPT
jgi:hypothetical protein